MQPDLRNLADSLGKRLVVTDRFAVATSSPLRQYGASIAREFDLFTQTHLNEQLAEKAFVEDVLYPDAESYTHVYLRDGLLDTRPVLAHCVHMTPPEWAILQSRRAVIAHCPTSNALLGSGIMALDEVIGREIDYAICTDVGASPTQSLLAEMAMFLLVHRGRHHAATACEALYRCTLAPATVLGVADAAGTFAVGSAMSYVVADAAVPAGVLSAEDVIRDVLLATPGFEPRTTPAGLDALASGKPPRHVVADLEADADDLARRLDGRVRRVVVAGRRSGPVLEHALNASGRNRRIKRRRRPLGTYAAQGRRIVSSTANYYVWAGRSVWPTCKNSSQNAADHVFASR